MMGRMSGELFQSSGFAHERSNGSDQNEWLTPPEIIAALGPFDLDPCAPEVRPWPTAANHYSQSGLEREWVGRVWLNPPYGKYLSKWLAKGAAHKDCIALTFARTETRAFQEHVFPHARGMLFIAGRVRFHRPDGTAGDAATAPSVLIAFDDANAWLLDHSGIRGHFAGFTKQRKAG